MRLGKRYDQKPPEYAVPPEDFYVLEFSEYDDPVASTFKNRDGEYPMRIRLVFVINDPDTDDKYQGAKVSLYCDAEVNALNEKSIYHPMLALDPENEPQGGEDLDEYKGMKCKGVIKHTVKGDKTYANVASVKAMRRRKAPTDDAPTKNGRKQDDERELVGAGAGKRRSAFNVDDE